MPIKFLDVGDNIESCCFSADGSGFAVVFTSSLEGSVSIFLHQGTHFIPLLFFNLLNAH